MSSIRFPLAAVLLLLATACVTSSVQIPEPAPPMETWDARELVDVTAEHSTFLDVSSGYANKSAAVGGDTGVKTAWFRFSVDEPGDAVVTLTPFGDSALSVALYDDTIYRDPRREPVELGYRLTKSTPDSIASDVQRGVYYVKIASGPRSGRVDFVVSVTYRATPRPRVVERPTVRTPTPTRAPTPAPTPRPAPVHRPAPVTVTIPAPPPATAPATVTDAEPPPPTPPVLIAPERREAVPLTSGTTATTDIGGESGYRWRWYEVTLTRKGKLRLDISANGAPVAVELFDEKGTSAGTLDVTTTATHSARHRAGKLFIRVGPAANDAAARVTMELKVAVAPFIRE
jgi:hypothetical protein